MKNFTKRILTSVIIITVSCFAVSAQTNVSGSIYANTTWTKANSPYIVTDTVVVFPSVTLTIEPGVTVKFADGKYMEIRQGTFIAQGTVTDSITFTSNSATPHIGSWLEFSVNSPVSMTIDYCIFQYANTALSVSGYFTATINNSYFYKNNYCVAVGYTTYAIINECSFYNNISCIPNADNPIYIKHSAFYNNTMCVGAVGQGVNKCNLDSCIFMNNQNGVEISSNGTVSNCVFNNCGYALVHDLDAGNCTIANSTFCNNKFGFNNSPHAPNDTAFNCYFSHNHIGWQAAASCSGSIFTDNDTAIYLWAKTFVNNYIYHNQVGIIGFIDLYKNHVCNNTLYNIMWQNTWNTSLPNVCWCDTDSATIRSKIYDGYVNIAHGLVNFSPAMLCDSSAFDTIPPINCQALITTGVEQIAHHSITGTFEIYPNPASDHLTVELKANSSKTEIKIFNMLGELSYASTATRQKTTIDVSNLKSGIYIIQVATADGISRQKLIRE